MKTKTPPWVWVLDHNYEDKFHDPATGQFPMPNLCKFEFVRVGTNCMVIRCAGRLTHLTNSPTRTFYHDVKEAEEGKRLALVRLQFRLLAYHKKVTEQLHDLA